MNRHLTGHSLGQARDDASQSNVQRFPTHTTDVLGGIAMLADDLLQRMYDLAHCLHSDTGVALAVTLEACERIPLVRRLQDRRTDDYRLRLPATCLPQYCVYLASDRRERDQERLLPGQGQQDGPTSDDWLVRYVKFLIWQTMDRNACHVAVALGCFLYGYQPGDIANLAPELFNHHNIRRIKRRLAQQIDARFQAAHIFFDDHHTLHTHPPTEHERQLVHDALAMFTPWGCPHMSAPTSDRSILESHFDRESMHSDWERMHALIDPQCVGLARLIGEYNESFPRGSALCLEAPDHKLVIPCFTP
jgi:hypothetical protein